MYYVYVLKSQRDARHYVGYTGNLKKRILEHNTGCSRKKYAFIRGPWKLLYYETFSTKSEAIKHERFLKTGKGRERIKEKVAKIREVAQFG